MDDTRAAPVRGGPSYRVREGRDRPGGRQRRPARPACPHQHELTPSLAPRTSVCGAPLSPHFACWYCGVGGVCD
eukprot:7074467-Prymnesium_polylepis.2